ncbi:MAG TPA: hypothetical protein VHG08_23765 [Longimicrobium sp.]|nr:hypothetical protein [Longimicrobium sp.]
MSRMTQWDEEGHIRSMGEAGNKPEFPECHRSRIRFLAGSGVTDGSAVWELDVTSALCEKIGSVHAISFVATTTFNERDPIEPTYVTTSSTFSGGSATLRARTWDCRCGRRPNTPFDYHVAIAYAPEEEPAPSGRAG